MEETKRSTSLKSNLDNNDSTITSSLTATKPKHTASQEDARNKEETLMQRKYAYYLIECFVVIALMFIIYGLIIAYHSRSSAGKNTFFFYITSKSTLPL